MAIKDKICFHKIDRVDAKKIINIIGQEQYEFFYLNDFEKIKDFSGKERLSLIISRDLTDKDELNKLEAFSKRTFTSILLISEKENKLFHNTTIENAEYLMFLVKTLCRLSWVNTINSERIKSFNEDHSDNYTRIINLLDELDTHSKSHSTKVQEYAKSLGKAMGISGKELKKLSTAALFHDIGKTVIPKEILTNPNRLNENEFEIIKLHTTLIDNLIQDEFSDIKDIIKYHHEKYDGTGYPKGLKGEKIPLMSRILTIIDSYDAMTSKRIYNNPVPKKKAIDILRKDSNTHFDPLVVEKFVEILENE